MRPNGKRLLVIDDDTDLRALVTEALRNVGYGVAACEDGESAIAMLKRIPPPDLIIADLRMPEVSGWEVVEQLRADPTHHHVPVLIVSSLVTPAIATQLKVAGFMRKPFQFPELSSTVARLCGLPPPV